MLLREFERCVWALLFAAGVFIASLFLGGCSTSPISLPCEAGTCTHAQAWERSRDPFGPEPITYGTIFGPQPQPGTVTVEPAK